MKIACPHCDQHIAVDDAYAGAIITCPGCGQAVQLPEVPPTIPEPASATSREAVPPPAGAIGTGAPVPPPLPSDAPFKRPPDPSWHIPGTPGTGHGAARKSSPSLPVGPSRAAYSLAFAILFIPALLIWKSLGGIAGLFVGSLLIFLLRGALAMGLDALFRSVRPLRTNPGGLRFASGGLAPLAGIGACILIAALWYGCGGDYYYTVTAPRNRGPLLSPEMTLQIRDRNGHVELSVDVSAARSGSEKGTASVNGVEALQFTVRNARVTKVVYKGSRLREKPLPVPKSSK